MIIQKRTQDTKQTMMTKGKQYKEKIIMHVQMVVLMRKGGGKETGR